MSGPALRAAFLSVLRREGRTITYRRGNQSVGILARPTMSEHDLIDEDGVQTTHQMIDFLLVPEALILGTGRVRPQAGDTIVDTYNGERITYRVSAPEPMACYKFSDPTQAHLRIHCVELKRETIVI